MFSTNAKTQTVTDHVYSSFADYDSNNLQTNLILSLSLSGDGIIFDFPFCIYLHCQGIGCFPLPAHLQRKLGHMDLWESSSISKVLHKQTDCLLLKLFLKGVDQTFRPDLPPGRGAPSLSCAHMEGALCGTRPELWSKTSGHEASPLLPAGPATAVLALVKSFTHKNTRFRTYCFEYELRCCIAL